MLIYGGVRVEELRKRLRDKKRIVVKIGSSSLQHPETGDLDYISEIRGKMLFL